jgi:Protein of unknown function (DUF4058)
MSSPFPGMDPYLEQHWRDIHSRLVLYTCDQLDEQLPGSMIARVEERVVFETDEENRRWIYPDVKIMDRSPRKPAFRVKASGVAVAEPIIFRVRKEIATETFIHILDPKNGFRLVTVIEFLSMANKLPGEGQRQYIQKQEDLAAAEVSLVEIDFLRSGKRIIHLPEEDIPPDFQPIYLACVHRGWERAKHELYPIDLRMRLPAIRIPLRKEDTDIRLDLQAVVEMAYRKGRYGLTINYQYPPEPRLEGADAKWAKTLLKKKKKA